MRSKGFTLIELLVVIAIIALLLAILIPGLSGAKQCAMRIVCLSNLNGLSRAWMIYAEENDGRIVSGATGSLPELDHAWVELPDPSAPDEIEEKMRAIEAGKLFPYAESVKVYHCPADKRYRLPSMDASGGLELGGYRSYSIVGGMKGCIEAGRPGWEIMPHVTMDTIKNAGVKCVFVEEADGRGVNRGAWIMRPKSQTWVDPFAPWHKGRSTLGFGDGHGEIHRWVDQSTLDMSEKQTFYQEVYATDSGEDLAYMLRAYPYLRFF